MSFKQGGINWRNVEERVVLDDQNKWDRKATAKEMRVSTAGPLELAYGNGATAQLALSDLAVSQICHKLEIPISYYRQLPGEMKALVANNDWDTPVYTVVRNKLTETLEDI